MSWTQFQMIQKHFDMTGTTSLNFDQVAPSASESRSAIAGAWHGRILSTQSNKRLRLASRWLQSPATFLRTAQLAVQNFTQSSGFSATILSNFSTPELVAWSVSSGEAIEDNYHDL